MKKLKILVVDDNKFNQLLTVKILKDHDWDVEIADNGFIAIDKIIENEYDLILMDIEMPGINGYETARQIRESSSTNAVPIIALTAHNTPEEAEKCRAAGMDDHIAKPFNEIELYEKIIALCKDKVFEVEKVN